MKLLMNAHNYGVFVQCVMTLIMAVVENVPLELTQAFYTECYHVLIVISST